MIPMFFVVISKISHDKGTPQHSHDGDSNGGNGGQDGTAAPANEGH
jgi:multidrug efflux pump